MLYWYLSILICMMLRVSVIFFFLQENESPSQYCPLFAASSSTAHCCTNSAAPCLQGRWLWQEGPSGDVGRSGHPCSCCNSYPWTQGMPWTACWLSVNHIYPYKLCIQRRDGCAALFIYSYWQCTGLDVPQCHATVFYWLIVTEVCLVEKPRCRKFLNTAGRKKRMISSATVNSSRNKPIMVHVNCCSMQLE